MRRAGTGHYGTSACVQQATLKNPEDPLAHLLSYLSPIGTVRSKMRSMRKLESVVLPSK
jgi:hypothetical protein